jgi:beta-galactosidase
MQNSLEFTIPELMNAKSPTVGVLCDILKPTEATVVARYVKDYYAGKPAITLNQFGKGKVIYVGAVGDGQLYDVLSGWLLNMTGIQPIIPVPDGIELTARSQNGQRLLFLLNHTESQQNIFLDQPYRSLLDGAMINGDVSIAPREVLLLREKDK